MIATITPETLCDAVDAMWEHICDNTLNTPLGRQSEREASLAIQQALGAGVSLPDEYFQR